MQWSLLIDSPRPGWDNMAVDHGLLDLATRGDAAFLRLYQWEPHCLSFGRHEPALRRYDKARILALEVDCVRRPTGGRAVWHARELTYAVAAPLAVFGGLTEAYGTIHAMLATALRTLGAAPTLASRQAPIPGVGSGPCFAAPVGGEVLLGGRKVVGSAQLRVGDALLQHGSLLLEDDQTLVRELAGLPAGIPAETTLSAWLGRPVGFPEAADAIGAVFDQMFEGTARAAPRSAAVETAAEPHRTRFRSDDWTWSR